MNAVTVAFVLLLSACTSARGGTDAGASTFALRDGRAPMDAANDAQVPVDAEPRPDACATGSCCDGKPVSLEVDYRNCGTCGHLCSGAAHVCARGACVVPTCTAQCDGGECCGDVCCPSSQVCCNINVGLKDAGLLSCMVPIQGGGCPPAH